MYLLPQFCNIQHLRAHTSINLLSQSEVSNMYVHRKLHQLQNTYTCFVCYKHFFWL